MAIDRFEKVMTALYGEFPEGGTVAVTVGIGKVSGDGDVLVAFQENSEMLVTDNTRQTRSIGVRLIALSVDAPRSKVNVGRAVAALEAAEAIRVLDVTGVSVELEEGLSAPEGMFVASQRVDLR